MKFARKSKVQNAIPTASMADISFLLLVFFMVSTSFVKESQITIQLPEADVQAAVQETPEQIEIMITEQGTYLVNGRELVNNRPETVRNALQRVSNGDTSLPLTISADANARHQHVVTAMDVAGRLGFTRISIATLNDPTDE